MRRQFDERLEIRTTRRVIEEQVIGFAWNVDCSLVFALAEKYVNQDNDEKYINALYSACFRLHMISRMTYKGKYGISKLPKEIYREIVFEWLTDSMENVENLLRKAGFVVTEELTLYVYKCLKAMEDVISQLLSYVDCIIYPREFASVIDYIIVKKGVVPRPIYVGSSLPINCANLSRFDFKMPWEKI